MKTPQSKGQLNISILAADPARESLWRAELIAHLKTWMGGAAPGVVPVREELTRIILVDSKKKDWQGWVRDLDHEDKTVVLVLEEGELPPSAKDLDGIDDLLVFPFRGPEILRTLRHHVERQEARELAKECIAAQEALHSGNQLLERLLQLKTPKRFAGLKGLQVMSKHLSGLKPGGDYFDLFESDRKDSVHFLLVDSSSYGISAALLGMILSSSAKIASSSQVSPSRWVQAIFDELKATLGDAGHFSVFFGRLDRRDFSLHYQMYGSVEAFIVDSAGVSTQLEKNGLAISNRSAPGSSEEKVLHLKPKDRVVLLSDGFVGGVGGEHRLSRLFSDQMNGDPFSLINELTFQIKSKLSPGETFPGEDCTAIVIDVESRVLRLAPTG